ncbi:MAG: XRE family transcriptional regulator [Candidatus Latescibacterota bacterium]
MQESKPTPMSDTHVRPLCFVADRLRLARTIRGMTLNDLGQAVGVSRQYVKQLETGARQPNDEMVECLTRALCFDRFFLARPVTHEILRTQCRFRCLRATTRSAQDQAAACVTLFHDLLAFLAMKLNLPKGDVPALSARSDNEIERAADYCRLRWRLGLDAPIGNMTQVLEQRMGAVMLGLRNMPSQIDGFLATGGARPIVVYNPAKYSASRTRETGAHEAGHLVLTDGDDGTPEAELRMKLFAGALLVPRVGLEREFPCRVRWDWDAMVALKRRWKVGLPMLIVRAFRLGLIGPNQYRNAFAGMPSALRDGSVGEPEHEPSDVIPEAFAGLHTYFGLTVEDVARELGCESDPDLLAGFAGVPGRPHRGATPPNVVKLRRPVV